MRGDRAPVSETRWRDRDHVEAYLGRRALMHRRTEGLATLLEVIPGSVGRCLDLGCGDGDLIGLVRSVRPNAEAVGLDFSEPMIAAAESRFAGVEGITILQHDLADPLPDIGDFDLVVSGFAIHHLVDERKRVLCREVASALRPGGVFANLEHVASPSARLHSAFFEAIDFPAEDEDPDNRLVPVDRQLAWLGEAGFIDVDCLWKWREMALLVGSLPGG